MEAIRYTVGGATLVRVPYIDVPVDAATVGLGDDEVRAQGPWAAPTWADDARVHVGAAVWVVEAGGRRLVVDPALAADEILRAGPDAAVHQEAVAAALAAAGCDRHTVDAVVLTHVDGIGMAAWSEGDGWEPFFPNAEVIVSEREHAAITDPAHPYRPSGADAYEALVAAGVVRTVGDVEEVADGVTTRWTGAHGPGHLVVDVGGDAATVLGHLALTPLHLVVEGRVHEHPREANAVLREMADGRLLVGPLWPAPGAVRCSDGAVVTAEPDP